MKKNSGAKKERGNLAVFIIYEVLILGLATAITVRFCQIGLSSLGLYAAIINLILLVLGVVVYLAGFERMKKFFSSRISWACLLLFIPIVISFVNISGTVTKRFLFWSWNEQFITSITPSLMSTLFAIILLLSVILRNNPRRMFTKPSRFVLLAEDVLFISSFLNILCNKEPLPIPGITLSCQGLLIVAVLLSWVGIKEAVGVIWGAVLIMGVTRLCSIDSVMGFTGSLYLLCAFLSGVLQWLELDVHLTLDGLKKEFGALNEDAVSLLKKEPVPSLSKENKQGELPAVNAEHTDVEKIKNDKTTC